MSSMILSYLSALENHNDREWYHANQMEFEKAREEFESFVQELIRTLGREEPALFTRTPRELSFRLTRDTRFSHDKSPYLPAFRCHLSAAGKMPIPVGYYLSFQPGKSFLGGGLFPDCFKDATASIRDEIATHGDEWEQIITAPDFASRFTVCGTALQKVPAGYDSAHPQAQWLKHKSWFVEYPLDDSQLLDLNRLISVAVETFTLMRPFHHFLNKALADFHFPSRS